MPRDPIVRGILELAQSWEQEAEQRRKRTPSDPAAETLTSSAAELRARAEALEQENAVLSATDYAKQHGMSPQTVRRLCEARELDGAEKDANGDWRIPRDAKRVAVA